MNIQYIFLLLVFVHTSLFSFSTTNISLLYGNFNDNSFLYDVEDKGKTTFTLEHYNEASFGDVFFFTDLSRANKKFKYQNKRNDWYFEVSPRLKLNLLKNSFINNTYLAFQYNKGQDYEAILAGIGVNLNILFFTNLDINLYQKNQNIGKDTWQFSSNYIILLYKKLHFEGFFDKTDKDFITQNQVLYEMKKNFYLGTEWHFYTQKNTRSSSFQYLLKYKW